MVDHGRLLTSTFASGGRMYAHSIILPTQPIGLKCIWPIAVARKGEYVHELGFSQNVAWRGMIG